MFNIKSKLEVLGEIKAKGNLFGPTPPLFQPHTLNAMAFGLSRDMPSTELNSKNKSRFVVPCILSFRKLKLFISAARCFIQQKIMKGMKDTMKSTNYDRSNIRIINSESDLIMKQ